MEIDLLEEVLTVRVNFLCRTTILRVECLNSNLGHLVVILSPRLGVKADNNHLVSQTVRPLKRVQVKTMLQDIFA